MPDVDALCRQFEPEAHKATAWACRRIPAYKLWLLGGRDEILSQALAQLWRCAENYTTDKGRFMAYYWTCVRRRLQKLEPKVIKRSERPLGARTGRYMHQWHEVLSDAAWMRLSVPCIGRRLRMAG